MGSQNYPKKKLEEIINARLSDMFELIENHLKKLGRNGLLPAGIIITGGGGNIGTIEDLAKAALKIPSRKAELNLPEKSRVKDSTWAVAYGLCVLGFSDEGKDTLGNRQKTSDVWKKVLMWLKQFLP
jgi:cell division protein FtsA